MTLKLFNTLTRKKEEFIPLSDAKVGMYVCGPTVYGNAHIGHMRKYTSDDLLRKTLEYFGFKTKMVMNITDVGHLTGDSDEGEDKMEKGARKTGMTVWEVAQFFEKQFFKSTDTLNIKRPDILCRATEHIDAQINLIKKLEKKGFVYQTSQGLYFDISKFPNYTKLSGQNLDDLKTAVRKDVVSDPKKIHPADFALWLFTVDRFKDHIMRWKSPWGEGFPGWHIECSAMSMNYLGDTLDIHTGGIDHINIHHTNEIAQSEAATGKTFVRYWVHNNFLMINGQKMSKSLENLFTVDDLATKDFDPLSLRYLFLNAHYRDSLNFTWESLTSAQTALNNLRNQVLAAKNQTQRQALSAEKEDKINEFKNEFRSSLADDINVPQALAVLWKVVKSNVPSPDKYDLAINFDEVLGLGLKDLSVEKVSIPQTILDLVDKREQVRKAEDFATSDKLREELEKLGYKVEDLSTGPNVKKF